MEVPRTRDGMPGRCLAGRSGWTHPNRSTGTRLALIPCRDEQDIFDHRSQLAGWSTRSPGSGAGNCGGWALRCWRQQAEMGSAPAPRDALGLLVLADAQAPDPAERQPERQARALELWALLERAGRRVEPGCRLAQPKVALRANLGAAERWLVCLHRREKRQARQAEERCRARMQLPGREPSPVLLALPARPEAAAGRAGRAFAAAALAALSASAAAS